VSQSRFAAIRRRYYEGAAGAIFVYDISRESTFLSLTNRMSEFHNVIPNCPLAIVGNKGDLRESSTGIVAPSRGIAFSRAISNAQGVPTLFLETSAVTGQNITRLFSEFADVIIYHEISSRFNQEFANDASSRVMANGWSETKRGLERYDKKLVLGYLGFPGLSGLDVATEEILDAIPNQSSFIDGIEALREFLMEKLKQQLSWGGPTFDLDIEELVEFGTAGLVPALIEI
jgi:hypothetical protein